MKIVHILQGKAKPDSLSGVNKVVHWMATSQARLGHDVEVWGLAVSMALPPHSREYNLRLFPMTRLRVTLSPEVKAAISQLEPDTWVHFHCAYTLSLPAIAQFLRKRGLAYGVTPHGLYASAGLKKSRWKKRLWIAFREAEYLRSAAWIQAIGVSEVQEILRIAPGTRVVLIPNCQEPLPPRACPVSGKMRRPLIGFCGQLNMQHKGLDLLIEGFAAYKAKAGAGELWLIGDGRDRPRLERQAAKSGAMPYVRFFGAKHGEEKFDLVASLDAFIHSSRWDVLPGACMEAAALGRPLLISRETNMAEYVERSGAGLVLDETSAAGVARVLDRASRLYEANELQQMGENARALIEKEFRWEENARSFIAAIAAARRTI
ncbi:MAG: glycosyltransferase family 4 protein [Terracidiphilus sp.]